MVELEIGTLLWEFNIEGYYQASSGPVFLWKPSSVYRDGVNHEMSGAVPTRTGFIRTHQSRAPFKNSQRPGSVRPDRENQHCLIEAAKNPVATESSRTERKTQGARLRHKKTLAVLSSINVWILSGHGSNQGTITPTETCKCTNTTRMAS